MNSLAGSGPWHDCTPSAPRSSSQTCSLPGGWITNGLRDAASGRRGSGGLGNTTTCAACPLTSAAHSASGSLVARRKSVFTSTSESTVSGADRKESTSKREARICAHPENTTASTAIAAARCNGVEVGIRMVDLLVENRLLRVTA
jgi:hypothetical protein